MDVAECCGVLFGQKSGKLPKGQGLHLTPHASLHVQTPTCSSQLCGSSAGFGEGLACEQRAGEVCQPVLAEA